MLRGDKWTQWVSFWDDHDHKNQTLQKWWAAGRPSGRSPEAAQTKLQSIIDILPWKKGKDFFPPALAWQSSTHHKLFCFCFWTAEEKAGLHQNKSRPSGQLSWGTLCTWIHGRAQMQSRSFLEEDLPSLVWGTISPLLAEVRGCLAGKASVIHPLS